MCFSNVLGSDGTRHLILWTIWVGNRAKFGKKKQPIRNRIKIWSKVFIPEKLFFTLLMIMDMMFSPSSRRGEKFGWNTWLSENDLHPSYVKNFILQKSEKLFFLLWFLSSFSCPTPQPPNLPPPPLSRLTQKSGNLLSEDVHLFASSGGTRRVTLGWMGAKESPEPWQRGTNWQLLKLLQKDIFSHRLFCQPKLTCPSVRPSCACSSVSIYATGVTHQPNTLPWYPRTIPRHIW